MGKEERSPTTTLRDVPDRLLERILSCLMASSLCLVRAAATCRRWRRIIGHSEFFSSVIMGNRRRPPRPVAGNYHTRASPLGGRDIVFVPATTSPPPQHAVDVRGFSLDFLPGGGGGGSWELVDSSRSLLLLAKRKKAGWMRRCFPDLLVCEPVTRRYHLIPHMEQMKRHHCLGAFLFGCESSAVSKLGCRRFMEWKVADTMSSFKVICLLYQEHIGVSDDVGSVTACLFDRDCGRIPGPRRRRWHVKNTATTLMDDGISLHGTASDQTLYFLGRANYCLFWSIEGDDTGLLTFNDTDGFDTLWFPGDFQGTVLRVTNDDGAAADDDSRNIRIVCLQGSELQVFVTPAYFRFNEWPEWVLRKSVRLTEATSGLAGHKREYFDEALEIVTADALSVVLAPTAGEWMFSVDLETMEVVERDYKMEDCASLHAYPCELPWPPALHACIGRCVRRGRGRCSHTCIC